MPNEILGGRSAEGAFPFAKIHCKGERPTRSAVCTSSPLRLLRSCWTAFLSILRWHSPLVPEVHTFKVQLCQYGFSGACWPRCVMLLQLISVLGALMVLSAYGLIQGGVCVS